MNEEWKELEKRIETLRGKITRPSSKRRRNLKKQEKKKKKTEILQVRHKRHQSELEVSRIELFISSEEYFSELLSIIKKHYIRNSSLSHDISALNHKFISSNSS